MKCPETRHTSFNIRLNQINLTQITKPGGNRTIHGFEAGVLRYIMYFKYVSPSLHDFSVNGKVGIP